MAKTAILLACLLASSVADADTRSQRRVGIAFLSVGVPLFAVGIAGFAIMGWGLTLSRDDGLGPYLAGVTVGPIFTGLGIIFTTVGGVYYTRSQAPSSSVSLQVGTNPLSVRF